MTALFNSPYLPFIVMAFFIILCVLCFFLGYSVALKRGYKRDYETLEMMKRAMDKAPLFPKSLTGGLKIRHVPDLKVWQFITGPDNYVVFTIGDNEQTISAMKQAGLNPYDNADMVTYVNQLLGTNYSYDGIWMPDKQ